MITVKLPIALVVTFLWIGFVCAISFMEAWLKFRAPGITLSLGLGIGRIVFSMLNKVEWVFALAVFANMYFSKYNIFEIHNITFLIALLVLVLQTFWLLPVLDLRAEMHIQGRGAQLSSSNLHFYYIGLEVIKVTVLSIFGISLFKTIEP